MVKANAFKEFLPGFFYKDMVIVHQLVDSNNNSEKHYYKIGKFEDKAVLLVYPKETKEFLKNPILKGSRHAYDEKTNKKIFVWREGDKFFTPLGEEGNVKGEIIETQYDEKIFNLGWNAREKFDPMKQINANTTTLFWILLVILGLIVVSLFLQYMIAGKVGVQLFSAGKA